MLRHSSLFTHPERAALFDPLPQAVKREKIFF